MSHYTSVILADSPIRYYRLNESSGTTASDLGSQAQNATYNGGFTLGATGLIVNELTTTSTTLNGSTGYVSAPTTSLPTGSQSWSIEAWINMSTVPSTGIHIICEFGTGSTNHAAALGLVSNTIRINTYAGNNVIGLTPVANTTYHCVGCYDGTNLRLYINGVLQGTLACTPAISLTYCYVGCEDGPRDDFWGGSIQDVAIYSTALSALQVRTHFQAGLLIPTSTYYSTVILGDLPIRYHRLGEASGTFAVDLGSEVQPATINGGVTQGTAGLIANDGDPAMTFDGSTGYVALPLGSLPTGASAWSLECWVDLASIPGDANFHVFLSMGNQNVDTGAAIYLRSGNLGLNTYTGTHTITGPAAVTSKVYHLVGTYDGSTMTLYVNGTSQGTVTSLTLALGNIFCYIGCEESPRADFVASIIDEVAIYSTALSSSQVSAHYVAGSTWRTVESALTITETGASSTSTAPTEIMSVTESTSLAPAMTLADVPAVLTESRLLSSSPLWSEILNLVESATQTPTLTVSEANTLTETFLALSKMAPVTNSVLVTRDGVSILKSR